MLRAELCLKTGKAPASGRVATSDYLQRGTGYPSLAKGCDVKYNPEYMRDVLREYLNKKEFVAKCFIDRWIKA